MVAVCPKCDVQMFKLLFKEIEVDFCERCRGLWLDAGELEGLLDSTGASANDPLLAFQKLPGERSKGRKIFCPRCDQTLRVVSISIPGHDTLHLDKCPRGHGIWFDGGELQELLRMFKSESGASGTLDYLNDLFGDKPAV